MCETSKNFLLSRYFLKLNCILVSRCCLSPQTIRRIIGKQYWGFGRPYYSSSLFVELVELFLLGSFFKFTPLYLLTEKHVLSLDRSKLSPIICSFFYFKVIQSSSFTKYFLFKLPGRHSKYGHSKIWFCYKYTS